MYINIYLYILNALNVVTNKVERCYISDSKIMEQYEQNLQIT